MAVVGKLKKLEVAGGFLGGLSIDFSDRLNCVIGSRGSGKTTLLEILRLTLSDNGENGLSSLADKLLRSNLGAAQVRAVVEYDDAPGVNYTFIKTYSKPKECEVNDGFIEPRRFPVSIYSTDEIEEVANDKDGSRKRHLIDSFDTDRIAGMKTAITIARNQVRENATALVNLRAEAAKVADEISPLPLLEDQLARLLGDAEELHADEFKREEDLDRKRALEKRAVESCSDLVVLGDKAVNALLAEIETHRVNAANLLPLQTPNFPLMEDATTIINQRILRIEAFIRDELEQSKRDREGLQELAVCLETLHREQIGRYLELQARHAERAAKVQEISALEAKVTELRHKRDRHGEILRGIESLSQERRVLLASLAERMNELFTHRAGIAQDINDCFADEARISSQSNIVVRVSRGADVSSFIKALQVTLQGSGMRYGQLVEDIAAKASPDEFVVRVDHEDVAWLRTTFSLDDGRANTIIRHLKAQQEILLNLQTVELDDLVEIDLNISDDKDHPVYQESSRLSTGQKCTAILPILLMATDQGPLIIDQPENNLDNQYIFSDIVPQLEAIKRSRQLIFVTHNPNIPVLADAEQVFVFSADTGGADAPVEIRGRLTHSGSVTQVRTAIINLLEGGAEAFERRASKYGLIADHV